MDELIKRLVRWGADEGLQNHFIGSRSARKDCAEAAAALAEAQAEIARLREALSFYATEAWKDRPLEPPSSDEAETFGGRIIDFPMPEVLYDRGGRARAALARPRDQ